MCRSCYGAGGLGVSFTTEQGKALNVVTSSNVKVLVVGNPCNFSCSALICMKNVPDIPPKNFHALTRLDENRTKCQLSLKAGGAIIKKWGRSSAASTVVSIVYAIRSLVTPTPKGSWFSSGVYTSGNPYGIAEDIVFIMTCRSEGNGDYELVKDVIIDDYLCARIKKSEDELLAEKRCVAILQGKAMHSAIFRVTQCFLVLQKKCHP